jgi:hypothetical protein
MCYDWAKENILLVALVKTDVISPYDCHQQRNAWTVCEIHNYPVAKPPEGGVQATHRGVHGQEDA